MSYHLSSRQLLSIDQNNCTALSSLKLGFTHVHQMISGARNGRETRPELEARHYLLVSDTCSPTLARLTDGTVVTTFVQRF